MLRISDARIDGFIAEDVPYIDLTSEILGIGGLAGTPTGRAICEIVTMDNGEEED